MKINCLLASVLYTVLVSAHGFPRSLKIGGNTFKTCTPFNENSSINDDTVEWYVGTDGPITDLSSPGMACGLDTEGRGPSTAPTHFATARAGDKVELDWGPTWATSHKGSKEFYMASCDGDCTKVDVTKQSWFKIGQVGYDGGKWHSDEPIDTATIPSDLKAGFWILRESRTALHTTGQPQIYPHCYRLQISGGGSATPSGISIPGAFKMTDIGFSINIYSTEQLAKYVVPGPPVYVSGGGSNGTNTGGNQGGANGNSNGNPNGGNTCGDDDGGSNEKHYYKRNARPYGRYH